MAPPAPAEPVDSIMVQSDLAATRSCLLRLSSDFEAYQEQVRRQCSPRPGDNEAVLLREILPIIDHLEDGLRTAPSLSSQELRLDVKVALQKLYAILLTHGIERADDLGRPFDPLRHEIVAEEHDPTKPENTILAIREPGYRHGEEPFRKAKVVVNVLTEPAMGNGS